MSTGRKHAEQVPPQSSYCSGRVSIWNIHSSMVAPNATTAIAKNPASRPACWTMKPVVAVLTETATPIAAPIAPRDTVQTS